ncbi:MAG: dTDP-4-dehydrorhamnose reductase [Planctomycetota bacterium]|nr:dTDP-4-dehydrorhamnose reductase [Planctomycetota bacterium]
MSTREIDRNAAILGSGGMLGRCWAEAFPAAAAHSRAACDITSADSIAAAIPQGARIVVNCAAWTDVDGAEERESDAALVNAVGPGLLAARCREIGALLVHYSTDYVFSGLGAEPYRVDDPIEPINAYGRTKAEGERRIRESGCEHLIVRASWLYAPRGKNFVRTIARLCGERDSLRVVRDQVGRPSSCEQLVRTTAALVEAESRGVFHAADSGQCSWFEFASAIAERLNPACRVEPCTSEEFPRPARRPGYSVLDLSETERITGPIPEWRTSLDAVLTTIMSEARGGV